MAAQIMFCVVAHHSRKEQAERLSFSLGAKLFMDDENHGSNWNHHRALVWASQKSSRIVILEDDAIPVQGFDLLVFDWLLRFPDQIVSFYLGTGRPPGKQLEIAMRLIDSDKARTDFIMLKRLIHGVCYSIPPAMLPGILKRWKPLKGADYAISDAARKPVIYPVRSLVDHDDGEVVERHPDRQFRTERRKAWRLHPGRSRWQD